MVIVTTFPTPKPARLSSCLLGGPHFGDDRAMRRPCSSSAMQLNADVRLVEKGESHVPGKMTIILDKIGLGRMSSGEYQANLAGMNSSSERSWVSWLTGWRTSKTGDSHHSYDACGHRDLLLFISSSRRRIFYSVYTLVFAAHSRACGSDVRRSQLGAKKVAQRCLRDLDDDTR